MRSCGGGERSRSGRRLLPRLAARRPAATTGLAIDERTIFANEQLEVRALLVGELEEDPLALGVLETLAVALEELVRSAFAADADHQRLAVVETLGQLLGARREEPVGGPLEKEEGRTRLELRVLRQELAVARL